MHSYNFKFLNFLRNIVYNLKNYKRGLTVSYFFTTLIIQIGFSPNIIVYGPTFFALPTVTVTTSISSKPFSFKISRDLACVSSVMQLITSMALSFA